MISSASIFGPVFAMDIAFAVEKYCSQHNEIWLLTKWSCGRGLRITNTAHFPLVSGDPRYWNGGGGHRSRVASDRRVQHARPHHHSRALPTSLEVDGAFHLPVAAAGSPAPLWPPLLRKFLSFSKKFLDFAFVVASIQAWGATRFTLNSPPPPFPSLSCTISHILSSNKYQTLSCRLTHCWCIYICSMENWKLWQWHHTFYSVAFPWLKIKGIMFVLSRLCPYHL
jgi:hypothetical protein